MAMALGFGLGLVHVPTTGGGAPPTLGALQIDTFPVLVDTFPIIFA